jgi:hypothetical protein
MLDCILASREAEEPASVQAHEQLGTSRVRALRNHRQKIYEVLLIPWTFRASEESPVIVSSGAAMAHLRKISLSNAAKLPVPRWLPRVINNIQWHDRCVLKVAQ